MKKPALKLRRKEKLVSWDKPLDDHFKSPFYKDMWASKYRWLYVGLVAFQFAMMFIDGGLDWSDIINVVAATFVCYMWYMTSQIGKDSGRMRRMSRQLDEQIARDRARLEQQIRADMARRQQEAAIRGSGLGSGANNYLQGIQNANRPAARSLADELRRRGMM